MLNEALIYLKSGLQTIPAAFDKRPLGKWTELQKRLLTESELRDRFALYNKTDQVKTIGIITGEVSGGLEVVDVDCKYDLTGNLYIELKRLIDDNLPDIVDSLVIDKTRSGGYHIYYRCVEIGGNQKLARRPATPEEAERGERVLDLVETRGRGGFIVTPPSPGYQLIQGSFELIPTITPEQRNILLSIGRSFNEEPEPDSIKREARQQSRPVSGDNVSPFADYNQRGDLVGLLERHGWSIAYGQGQRVHLKRPGDSAAKTSGNFHEGLRKFFVFSSSTVFEPEKGYSPSDAFILLECNGDKKEAYRRLLADGYGTAGPIKERVSRVETSNIRVESSDGNGEAENLAADDILTEESIKSAVMDAAYIYFTPASPTFEVIQSLELIERNSAVKVFLVEVESLIDTSDPIRTIFPSEYRAEDIMKRYAEVYEAKEGNVGADIQEAFIEEFLSTSQALADPFEKSRFSALWLRFCEANQLDITAESIKDVEEKIQYNQQREEQTQEFNQLLDDAQGYQRKGDLKKALELLNEKSREINSKSKADLFDSLTTPVRREDMARRLSTKPNDLKTGYIIEKEKLLLPVGAITVVAAPSSHGKTSFLLNLALRAAAELIDKSVYFFSYEEDADSVTVSAMSTFIGEKLSENNRRSIKSYYKKEDYFSKGKLSVFEEGEARFFDQLIDTGRLSIEYVDYDSDTLIDAIEHVHKKGNAGAIVIDYMQMLHKGQRGNNKYSSRQAELQQICIDLKDISVRTGLPIIIGAQFNREVSSYGMLHYTRIREAADIEHIANLILGFWNTNFKPSKENDQDDDCLKYQHGDNQLYVEKLKHRTGIPGLAGMLSFDGNTGVINNVETPALSSNISTTSDPVDASF